MSFENSDTNKPGTAEGREGIASVISSLQVGQQPSVHAFQDASGNSFHNTSITTVGGNLTQHINSGNPDAFLREKLNPILNPVRKLDTCMKGTRQQLLQDLCEWALNSQNTLAWIYGVAGTGKSAVAVTLAEKFRGMQDQITIALTFHCVKGQETSNPSLLVPTICYQLANVCPGYKEALIDLFNKDQSLIGSGIPLHEQFNLLSNVSLFQEFREKKIAIIIDGLDEWGKESDQKALVQGMADLTCQVQQLLIIITSRPFRTETMIELEGKVKKFDLSASYDASADIKLLVESSLQPTIHDIDKINKIVEKAQGLFIWAVVALEFIRKNVNEKEGVDKIITAVKGDSSVDHPYRGLDELYRLVLDKHFSETSNEKHFKKVMECILATMEPIPPSALKKMLETQNKNPSTTQAVLDNLKEVVFDRNGKLHYHLSFAEFLGNEKRSEKWVIKQEISHLKLFRACMNILEKELKFNICHLENSYVTNKGVTGPSICERVTKYVPAELQYSSVYWTSHMIKAKEYLTLKNDLDCALNFMNSKGMIYWIECLSVMEKISVIKFAVNDIKAWANFSKIMGILQEDIASEIAEEIQTFINSYSGAIVERSHWKLRLDKKTYKTIKEQEDCIEWEHG
ncbi:hypothetical protein K435DRAFT_795388 [Dendrothele bispora CBS 962.96]|uniref:Nephrocystin 3-like N-terminal domain-containing protein n=1 Tax=Dendrothele bispora (strain CBS 962.96) TaxID=1314807 RepID=A0A4S8M8V7_DENBC|nr:hypothetical protein K435DRAFT_795388 [Dendrothele bispora CBS 962.96]